MNSPIDLRTWVRIPTLAVACFLAACQTAMPLGALPKQTQDHSIELVIAPPRLRQLEAAATVARKLVSNIAHYSVHLKVYDSGSQTYIDLATPVVTNVGIAAAASTVFNHLGPFKYEATVVGVDVSGTTITNPSNVDYDLTSPTLDPTQVTSLSTQLTMLPTLYSGSIALPSTTQDGGLPAQTQSVDVSLTNTQNSSLVTSGSYTPTQNNTLSNLQAGIPYQLSVTAHLPNSFNFTDNQVISLDPSQQKLTPKILPTVNLRPHYAVDGTDVGQQSIVPDQSGGAWVASAGSPNLEHMSLSPTGGFTSSKTTIAPSSGDGTGFGAMASDTAGGVWVARNNSLVLATGSNVVSLSSLGADGDVVASDGAGGAWVATDHNSMKHIQVTGGGTTLSTVGSEVFVDNAGAAGAVGDGSGGVWVTTRSNTLEYISSLGVKTDVVVVGLGSTIGQIISDGSHGAYITNGSGTAVTHVYNLNGQSSFTLPNGSTATAFASDNAQGFWWGGNGYIGHCDSDNNTVARSATNVPDALFATSATSAAGLSIASGISQFTFNAVAQLPFTESPAVPTESGANAVVVDSLGRVWTAVPRGGGASGSVDVVLP